MDKLLEFLHQKEYSVLYDSDIDPQDLYTWRECLKDKQNIVVFLFPHNKYVIGFHYFQQHDTWTNSWTTDPTHFIFYFDEVHTMHVFYKQNCQKGVLFGTDREFYFGSYGSFALFREENSFRCRIWADVQTFCPGFPPCFVPFEIYQTDRVVVCQVYS
ncbi:hypothetical protein EIN_251750 [Entamoeba invadens IP1]|uniref:TLDc domain-containing protein n=1 Tax=Entamoeba invadens IP1 TaxID=370355 RepID=A0A0A1UEH7_ENTIV|nr:hypothetical protein EIN_251750 [Entamoeba invadens IP1]ELP94991.1 hypothetical protein EIN_251750 [Entamoeba invadens IP1]|eukprot:XP_004261762.1 hypothetical protein EIN_251750 [Entamoeba invadens IP1]